MPASVTPYRGRFAPSPTGPLHLGSLIAALASYLDARHHNGAWLLRMEDLDPPREAAGAAKSIVYSLQQHGLHWDKSPLYQSQRDTVYAHALHGLNNQGMLFQCDCTRALLGPNGCCNGRCQNRQADLIAPTAWRIRVPSSCDIHFHDPLQGPQHSPLGQELADFVLQRKDSLFAYQLAVVVDDAAQGITHVVRGSDLLDSTPRQIFLQQVLTYPSPQYLHIPVITNAQGHKLSKQNHAPPLDDSQPLNNLRQALQFLHQPTPPAKIENTNDLLEFSARHWDVRRIPAELALCAEPSTLG